jgi:pyochelin synthetase
MLPVVHRVVAASLGSDSTSRHIWLERGSRTVASPRSIADSLLDIPEEAELVVGDHAVDGRDMVSSACRLARLLRARGIGPGVTVGWLTCDAPEIVIGRIAVHLLGATFLGVPHSAPAQARLAAVKHVGDGVLVVAPSLHAEAVRAWSGRPPERLMTLDDTHTGLMPVAGGQPADPIPAPDTGAAQIATVRLRRGVAGTFDPVAHTYTELGEMLDDWKARIGPQPARHVVLNPLCELGGDIALATLLGGGTVLGSDSRDKPARILATLERTRATHVSLPQELLWEMSREPAAELTDLSALRRVLHVGPPPPETDLEAAIEVLGPILTRIPDPDAHPDAETMWPQALERALATADEPVAGVTAAQVRLFNERCRHAALISMLWALQRRGALTESQRTQPVSEILDIARVAPEHHRLIERWLHLLAEHGMIGSDAGGFSGVATVGRESLVHAWEQAAAAWTGYLGPSTFVDYLRANVQRLPELMTGEQQATLVLFPGGRTDIAEAIYRETAAARYLNAAVAAVVSEIAAAHPAGQPLRVLEVGAGTGATTETAVQALTATGRGGLDYLFTDVSGFFLDMARTRLALPAWVRFGTLDVDEDPRGQGYRPCSVDVVIAAGVLNNARNADDTLRWLAGLLVPGGWLLMTEPVREHNEMLISQAFMMTAAEDDRRRTRTTFLSREQWLAVLERAGVPCWLTAPAEQHPLAELGQRLFVARR